MKARMNRIFVDLPERAGKLRSSTSLKQQIIRDPRILVRAVTMILFAFWEHKEKSVRIYTFDVQMLKYNKCQSGDSARSRRISMVPSSSEKDNVKAVSRYYTLLRDQTRRRIIEILGEQSKIGFKELRQELKLGVGTVYYHLDMLSDFLIQDKHRKYMLNDRGRLLHRLLRNGSLPPALEIGEAFSHRLGRWLFLSPVFAKTVRPLRCLPVSALILALGAVGAALAGVDPMLFFYFPFSSYEFETIVILFISNWIGLFLVSNLLIYILYRRTRGNFQLFTSIGIAAFPLAMFPYIYMFISEDVAKYLLLAIQMWSLLLISSALCFGKGLRLDKGFVISLTVLYLNVMLLVILGRLA